MVLFKKIIKAFLVLALVLFSFYYTDKAIVILESNDPIMKTLKEKNKDNKENAVNAKIMGDYLVPGYNGLVIDLGESFKKMKSYGDYNESLLVFEEVEPAISIEDYYDKYISSGNGFTTNISLVFAVNDATYLNDLKDILISSNTNATIFIDGIIVDNNNALVSELASNNEIELLSYNDLYDKLLFRESLNKLEVTTNKKPKYCYATYDNAEVLDLCSSLSLHTIIPTIHLENNLYSNIKGKLRSGSIISIDLNKSNLEELKVLINYIKQRGFSLVTLDTLLNEGRDEK